MNTCILQGGPHGHEHFRFEGAPDRILVGTGETSVSIYSKASVNLNEERVFYVYEDTVRAPSVGLVKPVYFD